MSSAPIYLDYAATTPLDPRVLEEMMPYLTDIYGNPSSLHAFGQGARRAVMRARAQTAALIGAFPRRSFLRAAARRAIIGRCAALQRHSARQAAVHTS